MQITPDDMPMEFTLESLREHFSDQEIAEMNEGDDPILPGVDLSQGPVPAADGEDTAEGGEDDAVLAAPAIEAPAADTPDPAKPNIDVITQRKATLTEIDNRIAEIEQSYDDGDLTAEEWRAQIAEAVKAQAVAQVELNQINEQISSTAQQYQQSWFSKVADYQAQYPYLASPEHFDNWDAALKAINSQPAYDKLSMAQRIEQAHRLYAIHYEGIEGKPLPSTPKGLTATQAPQPKATGPRTDPRPDAPVTLAGLTNAADVGAEDGRFAQIDRIADQDPIKGEQMFKSMSEADQYAYLNA